MPKTLKLCISIIFLIYKFIFNMVEVGFMTCTAASHQEAIKTLWLYFWVASMSAVYLSVTVLGSEFVSDQLWELHSWGGWKRLWCPFESQYVEGHLKVHRYNSYPFISFFAHLQSRIRSISIGIIFYLHNISYPTHNETKTFTNGKQI